MKTPSLWIGLVSTILLAGCGGEDVVYLKAGETPPPLTEEQKTRIRTEDQKIDEAERGNTPKAPSGSRR